jgi:hypothetical protein
MSITVIKTKYMFKISLCILLAGLFHPLQGINPGSGYIPGEDSVRIVEKVYLHIDREIYSPGDDIWFKGYLIDASSRVLTGHSNNLHVELISPDSKIIDSRIVRINEGLGNGDFQLSKTLISGKYLLRAYTNYMRNIGDQQFFSKEISVINSSDVDKVSSYGSKTLVSGKYLLRANTNYIRNNSDRVSSDSTTNYISNKLEISFFPEGGSLVEDVPSVVGFKAVNALGKSCEISGKLYTASGELISEFKSTHNGMGTFAFKPVPGVNYYVLFKSQDGAEVKREIPASFASGVVLNVSGNKTGELDVTIRTNPKTLPLLIDHDLSLTVSSHTISYTTTTFRIKSLNNSLVLPTENIPDGIVMLTLSETGKKPLCERLVFIQNNDDIKINLETDKTVYKQRDSVMVRISMTDNYAIAPEAYISLSAAEDVSTQAFSQFPSTISSWFLLESDIRGPVEEPSSYFDLSNPNRLKELDLLLLTQGWRDFEWKYNEMIFPPEKGFTISGKVTRIFADAPLKNTTVNLALFSIGNPKVRTVLTDSLGKFFLGGIELYGEAKLIASVTGKNDKLKGKLLLDSSGYSPPAVSDSIALNRLAYNRKPAEESRLFGNNFKTYIQYTEIINSLQEKYKLSDTIRPGEVSVIAELKDWTATAKSRSRHYLMTSPDQEFVISHELEAYTNVGQLVKARILSPIKLSWGMNPGTTNPLYLVDGVKVPKDNVDGIPLSWVARIDVLKNVTSYYSTFGSMYAPGDTSRVKAQIDGVVSIILRSDFEDRYDAVSHSVNTKLSGYSEPRIFYSPKHHSSLEADFKPDLRTTLLWKPDLKLQNNRDLILNFYNTDNSSAVKISVEGITSTGIPVTGSVEYTVH